MGYTARYAARVEQIFESIPEFDSSFMHIGGTGRGQNQMLSGAILKDWSERSRSSIQIQGQIQAAARSTAKR